tara:strand:+ start:1693 stop:2022 length:330 start_codon:yes stop_codon:yes gene_type:complete
MEQEFNTTPPVENETPATEGVETPAEPKKEGVGPIVGIVVIIIILIFGGLYMWGTKLNNQESEIGVVPVEDIADAQDNPVQLESELDAFDVAGFEAELDAGLGALEAEL